MADTIDWEGFYHNYRKPGFVPGFEVLEKLGAGAFGLVYKARKESIGKLYAIKFLRLDDDAVRAAVLREMDAVKYFAQVDHPNLVSIEDQGEVCGIPYIVMAYGGDVTLRKRLAEEMLPRDEAIDLFKQVARGVKALHDRSLVHFDLKPSNIYLRGEIARVGDYGLSRIVSQTRNSLSIGRGTPHYMAPEMLHHHGDTRCDIYSLGILLYELLVGHTPFHGDSEWEILRKHENEEPFLPRSIAEPDRTIIERCLQKDPEDRYQSVAELLAALDGRPAPAPALPAEAAWNEPELVGAGASRSPQRFFLFALALCFGVGAFAFAFFVTAMQREETTPAVAHAPPVPLEPLQQVLGPHPVPNAVLASLNTTRLRKFPLARAMPASDQTQLKRAVVRLREAQGAAAIERARLAVFEFGYQAVPELINALCAHDHRDLDHHVFSERVHTLLAEILHRNVSFTSVDGEEIPQHVALENARAAAAWHDYWLCEKAFLESSIRQRTKRRSACDPREVGPILK